MSENKLTNDIVGVLQERLGFVNFWINMTDDERLELLTTIDNLIEKTLSQQENHENLP